MTSAQRIMLATMARNGRETQLMAIYAGADWLRDLHAIRALPESPSDADSRMAS